MQWRTGDHKPCTIIYIHIPSFDPIACEWVSRKRLVQLIRAKRYLPRSHQISPGSILAQEEEYPQISHTCIYSYLQDDEHTYTHTHIYIYILHAQCIPYILCALLQSYILVDVSSHNTRTVSFYRTALNSSDVIIPYKHVYTILYNICAQTIHKYIHSFLHTYLHTHTLLHNHKSRFHI